MHDHQPVAADMRGFINPVLQAARDVIIPFALGWLDGKQPCFAIQNLAMIGHNVCIIALFPSADVDFFQPLIMHGMVPIGPDMLGHDRQCLQRASGRRRVKVQRLMRA